MHRHVVYRAFAKFKRQISEESTSGMQCHIHLDLKFEFRVVLRLGDDRSCATVPRRELECSHTFLGLSRRRFQENYVNRSIEAQ